MLVPAAQAQTGTVTGVLLNDRGLPSAGVRVAAMPVPREGETSGPTLVGLTLTDNNGRYTIEMLEPGNYYLTAGRVDSLSYYPGVAAVSSAKPILVVAGARISGIDFKIVGPVTHIVSGRVVLQPGQTLPPGSRVTMGAAVSLQAEVGPNGSFTFNAVPPGQYTLRLAPDAFSAGMPLDVGGRITDIEFRPAAIFVSGSVAVEGAGRRAERFRVLLRDYAKQSDGSCGPAIVHLLSSRRRVPRDGETRAEWLSGEIPRCRRREPLEWQFEVFVLRQPMVKIALTLKPAQTVGFSGQVQSTRGGPQPLRSIRMEAEGLEPYHGTVPVQPEGSFFFDKITPGDYTAVIAVLGVADFKVQLRVPSDGRRNVEIVMPETKQLSAKLRIEATVPSSARPAVTLRFIDDAGDTVPVAIDGSAGETPIQFSLREGRYRVTTTIRESIGGAERTRVKNLTSGSVDLLTTTLNVSKDTEDVQIIIGR
jgi:hypothetical protein